MPRPIFDNLNDYLRPARLEYREEIRSLAAEAITECEGDRERIDEWLHESIDGHEWVIYTYKAQFVALVCDCDALEAAAEYGPEEASRPELAAYCAMNIDVRAEVEHQLAEREVASRHSQRKETETMAKRFRCARKGCRTLLRIGFKCRECGKLFCGRHVGCQANEGNAATCTSCRLRESEKRRG